MALEAWNTLAAVGTFVVIAGTATAAVLQLRHMRGSNQILALTEVRETLESERYREATRFVNLELPKLLADESNYSKLVETPRPREFEPISIVANFFENLGAFVRHDIIDKQIACDLWGGEVLANWERLAPVVVMNRAENGESVWENFEYMAVISEDYLRRHPHGAYPANVRRMPIDDKWVNAARAFRPT